MKWDSNLEAAQESPLPGRKTIGLTYIRNKKQYQFSCRDFYEKSFKFYHNGKLYRYSTSVPDKEGLELMPLPDNDTVRGFTIYSCGIVSRNPKDGKISTKMCV